ncbi:MAG: hypothetical protein IMZ55_05180 [Acidobacteria bacterium]|nr:hypothetical protein [Acidobacteriota bacterium]
MATNVLPSFEADKLRDYYGFFDDFEAFTNRTRWTCVNTDNGVAACVDARGGVLRLKAGDAVTADNDEIYLKSKQETFKFAADKPIRVIFKAAPKTNTTFVNTNLIFGIMDGVAANSLLDTGGGPDASYSGAVFFKVEASNNVYVESSIAGTQTTVNTGKSWANGTDAYMAIEYRPDTATTGEVHFFWGSNEEEVGLNTMGKNWVAHKVTFSTATDMQIVMGVKAGGLVSSYVDIDYGGAWSRR